MSQPKVITICREFGSEGHEIGKALSEQLDIPLYDKDILALSAKESGLPIEQLADADEKVSDHFLSSYFIGREELSERLFQIEKNLIGQIAEKEPCIIVGRLADYILRERPNCIKVLIYSPFEKRVERISQKHGISIEASRKLVKRMDSARNAYYNYYSDGKWSHTSGKDLVLNRDTLGMEKCIRILKEAYL